MVSIGIKQFESKFLEARGGIEPPIMVLQTIALPLGYRAPGEKVVSEWSSHPFLCPALQDYVARLSQRV